jgi:diacylglycerol kinase family enzyme
MFAYANQLDAGNWRAIRPLLRFVSRYTPRAVRVSVDGRSFWARPVVLTVAVGPYIGVGMVAAPEAKIDDRQFDIVVRHGPNPMGILRHLVALAWGRTSDQGTHTLRGRRVSVNHLGRALQVHADGKPLGNTPARFELLPARLTVLVGEPLEGTVSAVERPMPLEVDALRP